AVAAAYRRAVPGLRPLFVGADGGFESRLVTAEGYPFASIPSAPLFGVGLAGKALAARRVITGIGRARHVLRSERIELVLGFRGYVSASPILAARSLKLPTAILELNAQPGLTNRLLGRVVDRVYVAYPAARAVFAVTKAVCTGVPLRPQVTAGISERRPGPDE